jgi:hypothetical protein
MSEETKIEIICETIAAINITSPQIDDTKIDIDDKESSQKYKLEDLGNAEAHS